MSVQVFKNLYEYDMKSCFYNILKEIKYPGIENIDPSDKLRRNVALGYLQKDNPALAPYLNRTAANLLTNYINFNRIPPEAIIMRNKDGIITDRKLRFVNFGLELSFRNFITKMIMNDDDKTALILYNDGRIRLMGRKSYVDMAFYKELISMPEFGKKQYFNAVQKLRYKVLFDPNECVEKFCLYDPKNDVNILMLKNGDKILLKTSFLSKICLKDLNRKIVWKDLYKFINI